MSLAESQVVDHAQKADLMDLVRRARTAHKSLTEAFTEFSAVIREAEALLPPAKKSAMGIVMDCEHCGKSFTERRQLAAPEYGYCSMDCYEAEVDEKKG